MAKTSIDRANSHDSIHAGHMVWMIMQNNFKIAMTAICACAAVTLADMRLNTAHARKTSGTHFYDTDHQTKWTSKSFKSILLQLQKQIGGSNPDYYFFGEYSHCDAGQLHFLAQPETLKLFHDKGVRQIFIEMPKRYQEQIDAYAAGSLDHFDFTLGKCPPKSRRQHISNLSKLIRNAAMLGINVYASDMDETEATKEKYQAYIDISKRLMSTSDPTKEQKDELQQALKTLLLDRFQEAGSALFIREHSLVGSSIILRGNHHLSADLENSLRRLLSNGISFSFHSEEGFPSLVHPEFLCNNGEPKIDGLGIPRRASNFLINLSTMKISKCEAAN